MKFIQIFKTPIRYFTFRTVKFLLPKTWNMATDATVSGETFQDAEFRYTQKYDITYNSDYYRIESSYQRCYYC